MVTSLSIVCIRYTTLMLSKCIGKCWITVPAFILMRCMDYLKNHINYKLLVPDFRLNCTFTYHRTLLAILYTNNNLKIISHLPDIMKLYSEKYECSKEEHCLPCTALTYWLAPGNFTLHNATPLYSL